MFWKSVRWHVFLIYNIYLRRIKRWWGIYDTERLERELYGTDVKTMWTRMSETAIDGMSEIRVHGSEDGYVTPSGVTGPNNGDAKRGPDGVQGPLSYRFFDFTYLITKYYRSGSHELSFSDTGCRGTDCIQGPLEYKTK